MDRNRLRVMLEIALMSALGIILGYVKFGAFWAYGGSISLVMVPIFIIAFRRGWKAGVLTGIIVGLLKLLLGSTTVHPVQLVLDYPLAYGVIGFAGLVVLRQKALTVSMMITGLLIGVVLRLAAHFSSGVVWFGHYAPEGIPVVLYSILYNLSYLVPEAIITLIVMILLSKSSQEFFKPRA